MNNTDNSRDKEYWTIKSVDDIQKIVKYTQSKGGCIYRGVNQVYEGNDRIRSSLYGQYQEIWKTGNYKPYYEEQETIQRIKDSLHEYKSKSNIAIVSDLRHFDAAVNVIDFSYNLYVALFLLVREIILKKMESFLY